MGILSKIFARPYDTVSAARARDMITAGAILVDVRTSPEWNAGHAPVARHLPLDTIGQRARSLPSGAPIVTICRSGMRSAQAARVLAAEGRSVASVKGGMVAWSRSGGEVIAKNGRKGTVA